MIKIANGKLTVSASYGLTQNLGDYSSQKATAGYVFETDADGDTAALLNEAQGVYDQLVEAAKMSTMAHLGIEGEVDDSGVLQPKLVKPITAPVAPAPAPAQSGGGYVPQQNGGGQGGYQNKPPIDVSDCPVFTADLGDGSGVQNWVDLRPAKADGRYKAGAADFRTVNKVGPKKVQVWLKDRQGAINSNVAGALQAAGIAF